MFYLRRSHCQALGLTVVFFFLLSLPFYFFCFPFHVFNFAYPLCPLEGFSLFSLLYVSSAPLSLTSLTFACLSVISRLALSEAREMEESLCDTWTHFVSLWLMVSVGYMQLCMFYTNSLCSMRKKKAFLWHLVFMHVYFCLWKYGGGVTKTI